MQDLSIDQTEEGKRLKESREINSAWRQWGPYLSERQWGTVREDYSAEGSAWEYLPHDHARSRAYRWGEDGIAGISDDKQQLCFALALWNGQDPILKERLFGLSGHEGNHGEDVKEYYFYLDNLPTHAYMKYLYKYPQQAFPYEELVTVNKARTREIGEYELLDTGIFDDNRYFDIFVEYAKSSPDDILIRFTIHNRAAQSAKLTVIPTLWFRNEWSFFPIARKPSIELVSDQGPIVLLKADHPTLSSYWLYCLHSDGCLFTENETNKQRLFNLPNDGPYTKDGINDFIVKGHKACVNPQKQGTKAGILYQLEIESGKSQSIQLRLTNNGSLENPFSQEFDNMFEKRLHEADDFYLKVTPYNLPEDMRNIQRQAFAGMLWNKQCYHYNVKKWLKGDPLQPPPPPQRNEGRNHHWPFLDAFDIFSMPDKWEYPWFASWDLSFHTITLAMIDPDFAKKQLLLLTREWYMSPDGQIPAYEWSFSDVNPPVQAWAAMRVYQIEKSTYGREDLEFLERVFQKLTINFTWWVNRKDSQGLNIFEGGFLGLDNIGAFDRSQMAYFGGVLEQPDATGWMGMFCLNCLEIALELANKNPVYEDMATKFFEHFVYIADAINNVSGDIKGLWDQENGFYYGVMVSPDNKTERMYQNNMAGIVPLFAVGTNNTNIEGRFPYFRERFEWFVKNQPDLLENIADLTQTGVNERILLSFTNKNKLTKILKKILDENQFYSQFGIRSVSKYHKDHPFSVNLQGKTFKLDYEPAESTTPLFGGNSNWRGPIWFPLNFLLIESLQKFHYFFDDNLLVEHPTGSGNMANLWEVSLEISDRLIKIFLRDEEGNRPVYGRREKFQKDPHWREYIHFHEYFNGDTAEGLGASCQTGWTGLVAKLIHQHGKYVIQHISPRLIESIKIGYI